MSSEYTAIIAALVLGALFAVGFVGDKTNDFAARIFDSAPADFSAKFIKP